MIYHKKNVKKIKVVVVVIVAAAAATSTIRRLITLAMSEYMTESEAQAVARWEVGSCLNAFYSGQPSCASTRTLRNIKPIYHTRPQIPHQLFQHSLPGLPFYFWDLILENLGVTAETM